MDKQQGGIRVPGPGKSLGRPPSPYKSIRVVMHFLDDGGVEYRKFMALTKGRERERVTIILEELAQSAPHN